MSSSVLEFTYTLCRVYCYQHYIPNALPVTAYTCPSAWVLYLPVLACHPGSRCFMNVKLHINANGASLSLIILQAPPHTPTNYTGPLPRSSSQTRLGAFRLLNFSLPSLGTFSRYNALGSWPMSWIQTVSRYEALQYITPST